MDAKKDRSPLEKLLGLFTEVNAGEGTTSVLLALNVFLLLSAYYIIKPVREALILSGGGAELKSYASAGQAILLLGAVPLYAKLASAMSRRKLINTVTLFFMGCLVVFYILAQFNAPLGLAFFLWVGIFNLMVPAQFWAFANDCYTPDEGKRLFAIVAFGASLGAVTGSKITGLLIEPLGVYQLMLVSCGVLGATLMLTNYLDTRESKKAALAAPVAVEPDPEEAKPQEEEKEEEGMGKQGAFSLVLNNRYLLMIAMLMMVLNWVNTTGEYMLGKMVSTNAAEQVAAGLAGGLSEGDLIGKFYSEFFFIVNIVGVLIQLFVVSRVIKYLGVRVALMILPIIALGGYALLAFFPILGIVRWAKTAENATDYSLQNTVRNVLFLPTTREEKYKAKQAIDSFFMRMGDVLSAALVFVGTSVVALGIKGFAMVNLVLVAIWLVLAMFIGAEFRKRTAKQEG